MHSINVLNVSDVDAIDADAVIIVAILSIAIDDESLKPLPTAATTPRKPYPTTNSLSAVTTIVTGTTEYVLPEVIPNSSLHE